MEPQQPINLYLTKYGKLEAHQVIVLACKELRNRTVIQGKDKYGVTLDRLYLSWAKNCITAQ